MNPHLNVTSRDISVTNCFQKLSSKQGASPNFVHHRETREAVLSPQLVKTVSTAFNNASPRMPKTSGPMKMSEEKFNAVVNRNRSWKKESFQFESNFPVLQTIEETMGVNLP